MTERDVDPNSDEGGDGESAPVDDPESTPGQVMGLAGLLKAWRAAAGARRGRTITQKEACAAVGRSVRWYGDLERGAVPTKLNAEQREALAKLFMLGRDERRALMLHSLGGLQDESDSRRPDPSVKRALQLFIDQQMPSPAYLSNGNWSILAYNHMMAEWWPWVTEPEANLMTWALLSREARVQYADWEKHAEVYVRLLKYAVMNRPNDRALLRLIAQVCADPDVRHIWDTRNALGADRDGDVFHMNVPALGETVEVVSHVLFPASLPECRLVVITWLQGDETDNHRFDALGGERDAWAKGPARDWVRPPALPQRTVRCRTQEEAAALAGEGGVRLPALSKRVGPGVRLTLAPSTNSVIWATRENEYWAAAEFDAPAVLARFPETRDGDAVTELDAMRRTSLACRQAKPSAERPRSFRQWQPLLVSRTPVCRQVQGGTG
ncbi:XRE family transcriptional regulator [Streptomyces sp. H27-H1]|uniref:MmyB family transcriptional regulator n=1 Tax=Streptomyces sp. H27-H1 TaxID=2996461 RepID=UPI002271703D|nr:XRE family transcriptional regulator [Streptomyces sp. H27-H1]MCY0931504.1 XRE family transcriptional regulator [Streptomyces sp. H27-H1]